MRVPRSCQVVPVLDVRRGQVVRGVRGERAAYRPVVSRLVDGSAPCAVADALVARTGASVLYVADLDALAGEAAQVDMLRALAAGRPGRALWIDAGFRDAADARAVCAAIGAAARPVFGSETLRTLDALAAFDEAAPGRAILSLDARFGRPLDPADAWSQPARWPATVIVMALDRVGARAGPDLAAFERLRARAPDRAWFGAGGVRVPADLDAAANAGARGWLVASALHDGTLDAA